MDIRIFCEGITDQKFIADFITKVYNIHFQDEKKKPLTSINGNCKIKIIEIGGCSNLHTQLWINELEKNTEQGFKNLIFFDADKEGNGNNGFSACVSKLSNLSSKYNLDYYIWPDHQSDGEIEDLIIELIPNQNQLIMKCMDNFKNCLLKVNIPEISITPISVKQSINHYHYLTIGNSSLNKRNYIDSLLWDLNFEEKYNLKKLKLFLDKYLF